MTSVVVVAYSIRVFLFSWNVCMRPKLCVSKSISVFHTFWGGFVFSDLLSCWQKPWGATKINCPQDPKAVLRFGSSSVPSRTIMTLRHSRAAVLKKCGTVFKLFQSFTKITDQNDRFSCPLANKLYGTIGCFYGISSSAENSRLAHHSGWKPA